MSSFTYGCDDKYKCPKCTVYFRDTTMLTKCLWKCPYCGEYIHISAPKLQGGHVLIRKQVNELKYYDSLLVHGQYIYDVIDIRHTSKNKVKVALKGFGVVIYEQTDFVSVITGGYYEDDWKEENE